jgi:hypothetical protein
MANFDPGPLDQPKLQKTPFQFFSRQGSLYLSGIDSADNAPEARGDLPKRHR